MHIAVIGAGALGLYYGGRFQEAGAKVTFLVREKRAEQINENGLHIKSTKGDYTIENVEITTKAEEIADPDLVLLSVKGYHLPGTLDDVKILADKGAFILPVLNGIEHIGILQQAVGKDAVLGGLCFIMATLDEKGHVVHSGDFDRLVYGELEPTQTNICQQLDELAKQSNIQAQHSDDIMLELWKKYMFITAFSGITTATNLPIGPVRENKDTFRVAEIMLDEMKQLANKCGSEVTEKDVESENNLLELDDEATSSMHQDRRKGLTLEVDHLQGGALRLAKAKGLDVPYIDAVHGIIKPFES
ncbi:ketopantoate reductase family protein [Virgibacillus sp. 179-BFC.A HS]|uniref:2-dehydropantoate 2-reductase n=1 Tax=Tigheibacillus jepli TaxID=3035914 RepID=A0ABU5CKR5_9BACI|nr:ketopantoate reductase family protein [Virgibacillus sp. 179-BFC.A HS]MDY0406957.1 ketopantoate reductase family protein [Virgibacillus sp. 179-BFC.A HS]